MESGALIAQHTKQLTIMEKSFLTTNLQDNFDPLPWFYGIIKIHKTPWARRPIISFNISLMNLIGVCTDSKFQEVADDMTSYFNHSNVLKEQPIAMDLPPGNMLLTADTTSMYTNIQTCPDLNQIVQYLNVNETKYRHLTVNAMLI